MENILTRTASPFDLNANTGLPETNAYGLSQALSTYQLAGAGLNISNMVSAKSHIEHALMQPTIVAIAQGNTKPSTAQYPATVTNGDFLLQGNAIATLVGDGLDEFTNWTFDLTQDPDFDSLTNATLLASAELTLKLKPTFGISTDGITIQGLGSIVEPIRKLTAGKTKTLTIDLLDYFSPDTIAQAIQANAGKLAVTYQDDAIVSFAKLELSTFDSGIFTVGDAGQVNVDFLADGSNYEGELAMFSLQGMGQYKPGSKEFIKEAARRALTNSTLGHVAIADEAEGARFSGILGAHERQDWNTGKYSGNKTFLMTPGDRFGFMLVPNGWMQEVFRNPGIGGSKKPLFSMPTTDPDDVLDGKQFADVTGDRTTFAWEDRKLSNADRDYNDLIFQVKGATGGAVYIDELINSAKEWRNSRIGQELVQSIVDPLDPAGNTANQALRSLPSTAGRTYRGWVGSLDPDDFYSFSLGMTNEFNLSLDGLSENANVEVLNFDGNVVFRSANSGKATESISRLLEHGAYRVRVFSEGNIGTPYNLRLSVKPTIEGITTTGSEALFDIDIDESSRLINMDDFRSGNPAQGWHSEFLGVDGSGFSTVIIDSGIEADHPFFGLDINRDEVADRIIRQHDYANNDPVAEDNGGHGTNVSSIVASQDPIFTGMAPAANIIHLKVMDNDADNSTDKVFGRIEQALQWVVLNAEALNIVSVNMSLSDRTVDTDGDGAFDSNGNFNTPNAIQEAQARFGIADELADLTARNVVVVSASGNHFVTNGNVQGVGYPSADPNSLSVGSVWDGGDWWNPNNTPNNIADDFVDVSNADQIAETSQRHATLTDIFAPGQMIVGAGNDHDENNIPNPRLRVNNTNVQAFDDGTLELGGTSMAAPHIAGMVVLAQQLAERSLGRRLSPTEFRDLLYQTGVPINDPVTGVTTFRRADMLALANAIAPEIPGNTRTASISIPNIVEFRPTHVSGEGAGDKEFEGHGPEFRIETRLGHNPFTLWTSASAFFKETKSDWTEFRGATPETVILNVAEQFPGWEIAAIDTPTFDLLTGIDQDHQVNAYPGTTALVRRYEIQGDTKQAGPFRDDDDPWVSVIFNPVQVTLRRIS